MQLSLNQLIERIESIEIVRVYTKMDIEGGYSASRTSQGYWQVLEEARREDHKYFENLTIYTDIKYNDRWAKINTTMKEKRIKERVLKCVGVDYEKNPNWGS